MIAAGVIISKNFCHVLLRDCIFWINFGENTCVMQSVPPLGWGFCTLCRDPQAFWGSYWAYFRSKLLLNFIVTCYCSRAECLPPRVLVPLRFTTGLLAFTSCPGFSRLSRGDIDGQDFVAMLLVIACFLHVPGHMADAIGPVAEYWPGDVAKQLKVYSYPGNRCIHIYLIILNPNSKNRLNS